MPEEDRVSGSIVMMGEGDQEWAARSAWRPGSWSTTWGGEPGDTDYAAVERVLAHAYELISMRIIACCVVPHHGPGCSGRATMAICHASRNG